MTRENQAPFMNKDLNKVAISSGKTFSLTRK